MKRQHGFNMRQLDINHIDEFNALFNYVFQVTHRDLDEAGWSKKEIRLEKLPILKNAHVTGWFENERLISQVAVYPMQVNIQGSIFKMGGLTGVGTYPEYAQHGLAKSLILHAIHSMRAAGQLISFLYPYSIPYYRKKGWEIINDRIRFTVMDHQLPRMTEVSGYTRRDEPEGDLIRDIYRKFALNQHGALQRGELEWQEYWRWESDELHAAVYYNQHDEPVGYLLYYIADDIFEIKDMVYSDEDTRKGLWNYISAHQSMVNKVVGYRYTHDPVAFLLEDSAISEEISPYYMARIIDVAGFLKQYPFNDAPGESISFIIRDDLVDENNGMFNLSWDDSGNRVMGSHKQVNEVRMSIQTLVSLLMGYRRPNYFRRIERIKTDQHTVNLLERIIPHQHPYFSDYF